MKGADEYAQLFTEAIQIDRLYLLPGEHARGKTFRIFVLPEGEKVIENGGINAPLNKDAVEVYGITGGQPGWTETYGWLHDGEWRRDFMRMAAERKSLEVSEFLRKTSMQTTDTRAEYKMDRVIMLGTIYKESVPWDEKIKIACDFYEKWIDRLLPPTPCSGESAETKKWVKPEDC